MPQEKPAVMIKKNHPYIITLLALFCSCSNLKYLPAGESLYTGAKVNLKTTGPSDKKLKNLRAELEDLTRPRPNKKLLGLRVRLWIYNIAGKPKKDNSLRGKLKYKTGEAPVLASDLNLEHNIKVIAANLQNQGYLQATVTGDTIVKTGRPLLYTARKQVINTALKRFHLKKTAAFCPAQY